MAPYTTDTLGPAVDRCRSRIVAVVIGLFGLLAIVSLTATLMSSTESGVSKTQTSTGFSVESLFDYEFLKKYTSSSKRRDAQLKKSIENALKKQLSDFSHESDQLLNDANQLKNLYLDKSHNGIVNYGSTGNLPEVELNRLKVVKPKFPRDPLDPKATIRSQDSAQNLKDGDRNIPLTDAYTPNEEQFEKIDKESFIKGDIVSQNFFSQIFKLISHNSLSFPLKRRMKLENGKPVIDNVLFYESPDDVLSEKELLEKFEFPQNFVDDLKAKHDNVVKSIPDVEPHFYSGDGYVMVGGGMYSWYALLGIETLRKVGSTLPVEVFLPDVSDYEYLFCDKILPKLNARCVEMHKVFSPDSLSSFDVQGYQYKAFALLASSFENAFLLDSDSYPVTNPDVLFESEVYKSHKMITWPDFWRRTTSPIYYDIAGIDIGVTPIRHLNDKFINTKYLKLKEGEDVTSSVTFHDREGTIPDWSTESGEMLINKKEHFKTLLLALYYNYDGPYGYYPLLSQGGAGEGDKETFVAAANFFGKKYYQVNKKPEKIFGWFNKDKNFEHSTIMQFNPIEDFEILQKLQQRMREDIERQGEKFEYKYEKYYSKMFKPNLLTPLFYHVHDPKMDAFKIMENRWTFDLEDHRIRNIGEDFPRVKFDIEYFLWRTINHYICELKTEFKVFDGKNWGSMCLDFMPAQLDYLRKSSEKIYNAYKSGNYADQLVGGHIWN
ncbi:hypothetical protein CANINC_003449 [Pichia inconspicua]|uniref:Alpha-1,2-mannosyltransferase n=1 Tax=Pichia inconspicua TaxID=52247 RepID=A0A4T0WYL7_9ASCO|nr:hypothetical protein CANINC_003449 [[Candida] inconspicua]